MSGWASGSSMPRALEQEEELRRQRVARHVVVEAREERVLVGLLEHQVGAEARGQAAREAGLAGADRPLDHEVARIYPRKMKYTAPMMQSAAHR